MTQQPTQGSARRCAAMLSAARLSGAWGTPPLLRVVGLAVGLGLRRVFVRAVLRLLDWWVRPRTVRVRHAGIGRGSGWRLDTGAFPVVGRYFDRFALRFAWFALHGYVRRAREFALMISQAPCQGVAHARYAGGLDRCDVSTIAGRLFQSGFATRSANRRRRRRAYRRTALARRLRDTARRASGTLGSFSPPMNRVRYTPARLLHALRLSLPHAPAGHDPQPTDAPAPQRSSPMRSAGEWDVPVVVGHAPTKAPVSPTEFKEQDLYRPHSACGSIGPSSNVKNNGEGHVRRAPKHR